MKKLVAQTEELEWQVNEKKKNSKDPKKGADPKKEKIKDKMHIQIEGKVKEIKDPLTPEEET